MSENLAVQGQVIFPRVHVARNERRVDRQPPNFWPVLIKQAPQSSFRIQVNQLIKETAIDQHGMSASSFMLGLHERRTIFPFVKNQFDGRTGNRWMIGWRDQDGPEFFAKLAGSQCDRSSHRCVRIGIDDKRNSSRLQLLANLLSPVADDDDDVRHSGGAEIGDGTLNYRL